MASIVRPTAGRAVHLRISPRPSNLGETREILRLISQFGEVEHYKNLKYDKISAPNTTLVIFKDGKAAYECLKGSPIRFRMGRASTLEEQLEQYEQSPSSNPPPPSPPAQESPKYDAPATSSRPTSTPWGLSQTRSMSTNSSSLPEPPSRTPHMPFQAPPPPMLESRIFQVLVNPARAHFRDQVNMGHYHGSFDLNTKSIAQNDLAQTVPLPGLSCVINPRVDGNKPWRHIREEKDREHQGFRRRKTLKELYEEGPQKVANFRDEALPA